MSKIMRVFILLLVAEGVILFNTWASAQGVGPSRQANTTSFAASNQMVFNGVVQSIDGSQWTINNKVFDVDPSAVQYGTLTVGSSVKVQAQTNPDGSITVSSIGPQDSPMLGINTTANRIMSGLKSSANSIMAMATPGSSSSDENEKSESKITGTLTGLTANSVSIDGKVYALAPNSEVKDGLKIGDMVKLEFIANPDGTFTVEELNSAHNSKNENNSQSNFNSNSNSNGNNGNFCSDDEHDDDHQGNSNSNSGGSCHESDDGDD